MLEWLLKNDQALFLFLNGWGSSTWDPFWLLLSEKWIGAPLLAYFLFTFYKQSGFKKSFIALIFIGLLILCTDQLANFFKYGIARARPCHLAELETVIRLVKSSCGGAYGFFSAHAANSTAVAIFMGLLLKKQQPWFIYIALALSFLIGFSRIYLGVHYPLDVFFGFCMGSFLAFLWARIYVVQFFRP